MTIFKKNAGLAGLTLLFALSAHAEDISNTTLKWTERFGSTAENTTAMDNKMIYSYQNENGDWVKVADADTINWATCDILLDGHPNGDWLHVPKSGAWTVKSLTIQNMVSPDYVWWMTGVGHDINVLGALTIKSSLNGEMGQDGTNSTVKITAGSLVIDATAGAYSTNAMTVALGGNGGHSTLGAKALDVAGDMTVTGNASIFWNGRAGGASDPSFKLGGVLRMGEYGGKIPNLIIKWWANPNYSTELIDGQEFNTAHHYFSMEGLEGKGTISHKPYGMGERAFANFTLNNTGKNDFTGKFYDDNNYGEVDIRYTNFIKNGVGTQVLRITDDSSLRSFITVNEGAFLMYNGTESNTKIDVSVKAGAVFGAVMSSKGDGELLKEVNGKAVIRNLNLADGASLLVYADSSSNSNINVADKIMAEGFLKLLVEGDVDTGDFIGDFLTWDATDASGNQSRMGELFDGKKVSLFVNGVEYEIEYYTVGANGVSITVGALVPEPSAIAAALGALALVFAARRRRG